LSREELSEELKMIFSVAPDFNYDIQDIFAKSDKVSVRFISQFTHSQVFMGIPPTGKQIQFSQTAIFKKFKDGQVAEVRKDIDFLGMWQQLGMELKPKEGEK
jgi:predicted ester cyclase